MAALNWIVRSYEELSKDELFDMCEVRQEVFVVEQNCPYQDCDQKDKQSHHLMCYNNELLVAYLRIVKPGISYKEPSIGRVLTKLSSRKKGLGIELMKQGLAFCALQYPATNIRISAQQYLLPFYQSLGFYPVGEGYLEDDIPHMEMCYTSVTKN